MQQQLDTWVKHVQQLLGDELVGLLLYGSAARNDLVAKRSDLNLFVVLREVKLARLLQIQDLAGKYLSAFSPQLVFWGQAELEHAWDIFPLEFEDIVDNHRLLAGEDSFLKQKVDRKHLRHQLEFELRSKLLAMRGAWLQIHADQVSLERYLVKAGSSFAYLLRKAGKLIPQAKLGDAAVFETIGQLRKREQTLKKAELQDLYHRLHAAVESATAAIDAA